MIDSRLRLLAKWALPLWALILLVLTQVPLSMLFGGPAPSITTSDKAVHIFMFAIMGFLWQASLASVQRPVWGYSGFATRAMFYSLIFAAITELLQGAIGIRHADWGDMLANTAGISLSAALFLIFFKQFTRG